MSEYSRIYCDMDRVLCDFEKNIKILHDTQLKMMSINPKHERCQPIVAKSDFSNNAQVNDGKNLWRFIEKYDPHILSAPRRPQL